MSNRIEIWKNEETNCNHPFGEQAEERIKHINNGYTIFYDREAERIGDLANAHGWKITRIAKPESV